MKNSQYIDQIKLIINSNIEILKEKNEAITREFYESIELKNRARAALNALVNFGFQLLKEDKFDQLYKKAIADCRHTNQTGMSPSISLKGENCRKKTWLTIEREKELNWLSDELISYRSRYLSYLEKNGRSIDYIEKLGTTSKEILKNLGDPKSNTKFFVKGLVVGSVQSGKTENFNAVINSAVDAGYDLIIVLSGIMEDLRRQTQERIEKDVEGKYEGGVFKGVGEISSFGPLGQYKEIRQVIIPTSQKTDFNKSIKEAEFTLNNKNILVCKKNTSVLKNLLLWLHKYLNKNRDKIDIPFLIIDDEADNASLNNLGSKGIEYASTINKEIRALLGLFNKKCYLGYTATPFGNILQDRHPAPETKWKLIDKENGETIEKEFDVEKSLFPEDFIELLSPPPNYIGAKHFFETQTGNTKKITSLIPSPVSDHFNSFPSRINKNTLEPAKEYSKETRATTKEDEFPKEIPKSLKDAILCFVISTSIRLSRKSLMLGSKLYQPHNTMLIHISRFTSWQTRTKKLVEEYVDEIKYKLENDFPSDIKSIYAEFERIWNIYYAFPLENIKYELPDDYEDDFLIRKTFDEIKPLLLSAIKDLEIKAINSETGDVLLYPEDSEKKYIAIGGNRLSRGFTLQGLTINYFIRDTNFADTLLQMGRWFGYRPGYIDCCKLFSTNDSLDKFDLITETIENLEEQFKEMNGDNDKNHKNTPDKYAIRVQKHPGTLQITRPSILKNAIEVKWPYSNILFQTTQFHLDPDKINSSWNKLKEYISRLDHLKKLNKRNDFIIYETNDINQIFNILRIPSIHIFRYGENTISNLIEYIKLCNNKNKLTNWTIAIKTTGNGKTITDSEIEILNGIQKTSRSGPLNDSRWYQKLKNEKIFAAGQSSANIVTGPKDLAIRLTSEQIQEAESDYLNQYREMLRKNNLEWSESRIENEVNKIKIPEKVYRQKMSDNEAILIIYLLDLEDIFKNKNKEIYGLDDIKQSLDLNIPLIGYAIGFPIIDDNIGEVYYQSKFHLEADEQLDDNEIYDDYKDILE